MRRLALLPVKVALIISTTLITLTGAITGVFAVLDVTGITQGQTQNMLQMPGNLNELIDLGIDALKERCPGA